MWQNDIKETLNYFLNVFETWDKYKMENITFNP